MKMISSFKVGVLFLFGFPLMQWIAERTVTLPIGPSRMITIGLCALALIPVGWAVLETCVGALISPAARRLTAIIVPILAIAHLLVVVRFFDGPFGPVPGGPFQSEAVAPPADWSDIRPFPYVEIEVGQMNPRSLETVFLVYEERLYVAANMPEKKRWPHALREDEKVRVRFEEGAVFALDAKLVDSAERTTLLRDAMNAKYGFDLSMGGPIWFFRLTRS